MEYGTSTNVLEKFVSVEPRYILCSRVHDLGQCLKDSPLLVPVDDEVEWQRRELKRVALIERVKLTEVYHEYKGYCSRMSVERTPTPDPCDRSISKRRWELITGIWRHEMRSLESSQKAVVEHHLPTLS